jgi:hypothetical protein
MTCPRNPAADVADRSQLLAMALLLDDQAPASGPVEPTGTQPSNGARIAMIERRASRLRFPNEVQRQRYISRHSAGFSTGDAQ